MKLSRSRGYIVDESGHIVSATEIMAEIERLKERNVNNVTAYSQELTARTTELQRAEAEIERLRAELKENEGVIRVWRRRTEAAEARLAKVVEILLPLLDPMDMDEEQLPPSRRRRARHDGSS